LFARLFVCESLSKTRALLEKALCLKGNGPTATLAYRPASPGPVDNPPPPMPAS
jgi:hypothetical protein